MGAILLQPVVCTKSCNSHIKIAKQRPQSDGRGEGAAATLENESQHIVSRAHTCSGGGLGEEGEEFC